MSQTHASQLSHVQNVTHGEMENYVGGSIAAVMLTETGKEAKTLQQQVGGEKEGKQGVGKRRGSTKVCRGNEDREGDGMPCCPPSSQHGIVSSKVPPSWSLGLHPPQGSHGQSPNPRR